MSRGAVLRALLIAVLLVAIGAVFGTAVPAQAAPKPIGLSSDGVSFADSLTSSVFAGAAIVPGTSVTRTFWVQNRAADPGNFAIAVNGVTSGDSAFLGAVSLQVTAGATTGPAVALSTVGACRTLVSAVSLASGAMVRVDATISLSTSLTSVTSQSSVGSFDLPVTMTSADVAAPTGCSASTPGGGGTGGGTTQPHSTPHGQIDTALVSGASAGAVDAVTGPLPDAHGNGVGYVTEIRPNTGRFYQEFDVLGWLAALVLSGIVALWRSRREPEERYR